MSVQQERQPATRRSRHYDTLEIGCLARLHIYEENARFVLAVLLVVLYLLGGALLFSTLERQHELDARVQYSSRLSSLKSRVCGINPSPAGRAICLRHLETLLEEHAEAVVTGTNSNRDRFDFFGALFFSATLISTIGFGTSTPQTLRGRAASIAYGLVGCTCCVLFFNLFLERLVTLLSHLLRYLHDKKIERRAASAAGNRSQPVTLLINNNGYHDTASSCGEGAEEFWRPSVYKVFLCLVAMNGLFFIVASSAYAKIEGWSPVDAAYFCFTSFATIGFGDLVSHEEVDGHGLSSSLYRPLNFLLLSLGASSFYSLFNVSSLVLRQLLNFIIKKMDVKMERGGCWTRKKKRYMGLGLRPPKGYDFSSTRSSIDCQDGLLSLKEFLMNNQSSVILLQKHIIKNAGARTEQKISASRVGPMGMLCEAFGDG